MISGAIKGDIDLQCPVIIDSISKIMGNIKSKAVQIRKIILQVKQLLDDGKEVCIPFLSFFLQNLRN